LFIAFSAGDIILRHLSVFNKMFGRHFIIEINGNGEGKVTGSGKDSLKCKW